jgi:mRNA interferase HigB
MRIISRKALREFWQRPGRGDAEQPLKAWYQAVARADWSNPAEVKAAFRNVSIVRHNRLVFNIAGNKYRLVARVNYSYRVIYIRFVGTHQEYDRIDAAEV